MCDDGIAVVSEHSNGRGACPRLLRAALHYGAVSVAHARAQVAAVAEVGPETAGVSGNWPLDGDPEPPACAMMPPLV